MAEEKSLYKKFRPKTLKGVVGQDGAISSLMRFIENDNVPHALLLTGPSGCGKTTIARILKEHLDCGDQDFMEINCADFKGIDMIRDIRRYAALNPISGSTRVWLIDEAHKLTGDAQNAFLKLLEDTPAHVYFMLATTDPQKLISTVLTRCSEVKLVSLSEKSMAMVLQRVIDRMELKVSPDIIAEIIDAAAGSARKALVILEQIAGLVGDAAQLEAIQSTTLNKDEAIKLARLMFNPRCSWAEVAAILTKMKDQDPEGIRYMILGYYRSVLLGGKNSERAFKIIDIFSKNFYDSKQAGLCAACYEVVCM